MREKCVEREIEINVKYKLIYLVYFLYLQLLQKNELLSIIIFILVKDLRYVYDYNCIFLGVEYMDIY